MEDIRELLGRVGLGGGGVERIHLAQGVVGKTTYVTCTLIGVIGIAIYSLAGVVWAIVLLALLAAVVFLIYFGGVLWFSHKHPGLALLEGADLVRWRQMDLGARGLEGAAVPDSPIIANPEYQSDPRVDER